MEVNENETKMPVSDNILEELKYELKMAKQREINTFELWEADLTPVTKQRKEFQLSQSLRRAFEKDIVPTNFKPYLFIPNQVDINECLDIIQQNYNHIRNLYLLLSSTRGSKYSINEEIKYPFISKNRMKDFLHDLEILAEDEDQIPIPTECGEDNNQVVDMVTISEVDEIFDASNLEYENDDENPDDLLIRIELVEFIMRLAQIQNKKVTQL